MIKDWVVGYAAVCRCPNLDKIPLDLCRRLTENDEGPALPQKEVKSVAASQGESMADSQVHLFWLNIWKTFALLSGPVRPSDFELAHRFSESCGTRGMPPNCSAESNGPKWSHLVRDYPVANTGSSVGKTNNELGFDFLWFVGESCSLWDGLVWDSLVWDHLETQKKLSLKS